MGSEADTPVRAFAPGRVNLIGEHTDYSSGLSMPFAIGSGVEVRAWPVGDRTVRVEALALDESDEFDLDRVGPAPGWRAYVRGTAAELDRAVGLSRGARIEIGGDLPMRAGLGSSAALCAAVRLGLAAAAGSRPQDEPWRVARALSRVESAWAGAQTGILDQLASLLGRRGHAVLLDFAGGRAEHVPLELGEWKLAVLDSGVPRANAESGYNRRRSECDAARAALRLGALGEASERDLTRLPAPLRGRARHVITENGRVRDAAQALRRGDVAALGPLLDASHASLRDDFEVSVRGVDDVAERARAEGATGARIHGGGFGGGVLALFPPGVEPPSGAIAAAPGDGARLL